MCGSTAASAPTHNKHAFRATHAHDGHVGGAAAVGVARRENVGRAVGQRHARALEHVEHPLRLERAFTVVDDHAHAFAHEQVLPRTVHCAHQLRRLERFPAGTFSFAVLARAGVRHVALAPVAHHAHLDDVEQRRAARVHHVAQLAVVICVAFRRADHQQAGAVHFQQRDDHLVEHVRRHEGRLWRVKRHAREGQTACA